MQIIEELERTSRDRIIEYIREWNTEAEIPKPSEWAAKNRYLPSGQTEYPGIIDHSIAPHMVEIQDCFHPDSGIDQVSVMKSTQSLATTTMENVIGHSMRYKLHNILYIISTKNIGRIRSSSAIDVMIDNSGLSKYVKPISTRMKRKLADSTFYKEVGGRRFMITSWNSIADAKSLSWDLIIMDELDEAPYELKGQGDPEAIFAGRAKTIRDKKIGKIGTPTNVQGRINQNFLQGDQRYFHCKCPMCGELQILTLKGLGREYGLMARSEKSGDKYVIISDSVRYICKFCKKDIREFQKQSMLTGGKWIPTATPINPRYRSYHISNLISPVMFYTWDQAMQEFCETEFGQKITKFKNFVIDVLGEPWESRSEKKSWKEVYDRSNDYKLGIIPDGVLALTAGADVQKNRIEVQVVGWGHDMRSWVVDYKTFFGDTSRKNNDVWLKFIQWLFTTRYKFKGTSIPILRCAVDTGYNPKRDDQSRNKNDLTGEHTVYEIVAKNNTKLIACRGNDSLKDTVLREERVKRQSALKIRYEVAVSDLKDEIFAALEFPFGSEGSISFTKELGELYFKGFLSEVFAEIAPNKWGWKKIFERNEPLDTWILARAAAEWMGFPVWSHEIWHDFERRILSKR